MALTRVLWFPRCRKCRRNRRIQTKKQNLQFNAECHGMCQSLDELIKRRSLNQIALWTRICKYYTAKVVMNPACSVHLFMNGADAWFCLLTLHTYRASAVSMRKIKTKKKNRIQNFFYGKTDFRKKIMDFIGPYLTAKLPHILTYSILG